jgi:hypothetical protein
MKILRTCSIVVATVALTFMLASSAYATIAIGDPIEGQSWDQRFLQDTLTTLGNPFTHMEFVMVSAGDFLEAPGIKDPDPSSWTVSMLSATRAMADGPAVSGSQLFYWTLHFAGDSAGNPLAFDIFTYNGLKLWASEHAVYNGSGGWSFTKFDGDSIAPIPVPEPATMVAGALLLLPLGASAMRVLRRNRTA